MEKDTFHSDLRSLLRDTTADEKVIILGDFNARVSQDFATWKGMLGRPSGVNCYDNGRFLLEVCAEHQLITITILKKNQIENNLDVSSV